MLQRVFLIIPVLLISSVLHSVEKLPDDIHIRNLEQGFSYEYLYALKDGKIWIKPNTKNTGIKGEWQLFNKTGVPCGSKASSFKQGDRVVQFSTEGTMITAVSNTGRFYIWQPTYFEDPVWRDETGSPFAGELYLPTSRTWCFSFSTMRAPWKRQTPMHENDIVSYWEDIDGNKTEFGFTATIYSVAPDGQKIRYTDTGLPVSWNKAFASPERGKFIIENMSASASTVFVINKSGRMYTRMIDFELEGGCPALRFVYTRGKRNVNDGIAPLMTSIRTLPLPDWREQEAVADVLASQRKKSGKAALTGNITILLTGKGNSARELRVQGRDSEGNYGYWKKMIFDTAWKFVITHERFSDDNIIRDYPGKSPEGKTLDMNYKGRLIKRGEPDLGAELTGFYYYNTPATLRIHKDQKYFDLKFHTVDLWSPTSQKKSYPELIGSPEGEPKLLQGTIEIPDELLNSPDEDIKDTINRYLKDFNLKPLAFTVSADDRNVTIQSKTLQRNLDKNMDYEFRDNLEIVLTNRDYMKNSETANFFSSIATKPELELPPDIQGFSERELPRINRLIQLNNNALEEIKEKNKNLKLENLKSGCVSSCILPVYYIFNGIVTISGIPHWDLSGSSPGTAENITQLGGVSYTGGTPVKEYASMNMKKSFGDPDDYKLAVQIVNERLSKLNAILEEIKRGSGR